MKTINDVKDFLKQKRFDAFYKKYRKDFDALEETCNKIVEKYGKEKAQQEDKFYSNEIVRRGNSIFFDIQ